MLAAIAPYPVFCQIWVPPRLGFSVDTLVAAVRDLNMNLVKELLALREREQRNENINTALLVACEVGNYEFVQLFYSTIKSNISPRLSTDAINIAARHGHLDIVRYFKRILSPLNSQRPGVSQRPADSQLPGDLQLQAARAGHWDMVKSLLLSKEYPCDPSSIHELMVLAVLQDKRLVVADLVVRLIEQDINIYMFDSKRQYVACAFVQAIDSGRIQLAMELFPAIEHDKVRDGALFYALENACQNGNVGLARYAFQKCQQPFSPEKLASPCLETAVKRRHPEIVKMLMDHGAGRTGMSLSFLAYAARNGDIDSMNALLDIQNRGPRPYAFTPSETDAIRDSIIECSQNGYTVGLQYYFRSLDQDQFRHEALDAAVFFNQTNSVMLLLLNQRTLSSALGTAILYEFNGLAIEFLRHSPDVFELVYSNNDDAIRTATNLKNKFMAMVLAQFYDNREEVLKEIFPAAWLEEYWAIRERRSVDEVSEMLLEDVDEQTQREYILASRRPLPLTSLQSITARMIENDLVEKNIPPPVFY